MPVTIWFARIETLNTAMTAPRRSPMASATPMPTHRLPETVVPQNAPKAPTSIIPSVPRFNTPDRSTNTSPNPTSRRGVADTSPPARILVRTSDRGQSPSPGEDLSRDYRQDYHSLDREDYPGGCARIDLEIFAHHDQST